ncbi:O-glucosyltransferase rumi-like [Dorcoceras hygrometricum]|uniref:O-glucosyltransferase rumi-like n=1 Tax=Dorcoceras hygrometricum TaxID=472368 RepID=A0A2Z7D6J7_9LAMI|nr:O-glucosyltransferase rumi-like [Dorcoceras hygrometricum]
MVIGSLATLDLPMVVDLIGIFELKGSYCMLTMTDWFLQALSVISTGSWGDVARRFTMIRWCKPAKELRFWSWTGLGVDPAVQSLKCQFPRGIGRSQASRRHQDDQPTDAPVDPADLPEEPEKSCNDQHTAKAATRGKTNEIKFLHCSNSSHALCLVSLIASYNSLDPGTVPAQARRHYSAYALADRAPPMIYLPELTTSAYDERSSKDSQFRSGPKLLYTKRQLPDELPYIYQLSCTFQLMGQGSAFVHPNRSRFTNTVSSHSKRIPCQQLSSKDGDYEKLLTLMRISTSLRPKLMSLTSPGQLS